MSVLGRMFYKAATAVGSLFRSAHRSEPPGALAAFATEDGAAKLHTQVLNKNMSLKTLDKPQPNKPTNRPLLVMMAWMLAKESHLDKYRKIYFDKGFDILTVHLSPLQMMFPTLGSHKIARNLTEFLHECPYREFVLHGFSVGGYLFAEAMLFSDTDQQKYSYVWSKFTGVILDSAVDFYGIPTGFPRAVFKNPMAIKLMEWITRTHLFVCYRFATRHYLKAHHRFYNTSFRCPVLMLVSRDDVVGNPEANKKLGDNWKEMGIDVKIKVWDKSAHVSHMLRYPEEYVAEVNRFLAKVNAGKLAKSNI